MKKFKFFVSIGLILLMAFPAYATVSSEVTRVKYTCDGTTTVYAYPFKIYEDDDLLATKALTSTGAETALVLNTDYTVSGAGVAGGGNLTLTAGSVCASGYTLTILRNIELTQKTDYVDGQAFSAESLESAIDKVTLIQQQQNEAIGRAPKLPKTSSITDIALPNPAASHYIGWNAGATQLENKTSPVALTTATQYEIDALVTYGGGSSFTQTTIEAALTAIGTTNKVTLLLRPGTWVISSNADWSAYTNVVFKIVPGALISHGAFNVTFGGPLDAGLYRIFSGTGGVLGTSTTPINNIYPEWWGALRNRTEETITGLALQAAINMAASISNGATVRLQGTYQSNIQLVIGSGGISVRGGGDYQSAIYFTGCSGIKINRVSNVTLDGFVIGAAVRYTTTVNAYTGIEIDGVTGTRPSDININNIYIDGFYIGVSALWTGSSTFMNVSTYYGHIGMTIDGLSVNNNVTGCSFVVDGTAGSRGIAFLGTLSYLEGWWISHNLIFQAEIGVYGAATSHVYLTNNIIDFNGVFGVYLTETTRGCANWVIDGNYIAISGTAATAGVLVNQTIVDASDRNTKIINNDILAYATANVVLNYGIRLMGAATIPTTISGNSTQNITIYDISSADTGNVIITDNYCLSTTPTYNIFPIAGGIVENNVGTVYDNGGGLQTLANSATPSVKTTLRYPTHWLTGGTTTITSFSDGFNGQEIAIISAHAITITDGTSIFLNGSINFVMKATDTLTLVKNSDGKWYEKSRSVN